MLARCFPVRCEDIMASQIRPRLWVRVPYSGEKFVADGANTFCVIFLSVTFVSSRRWELFEEEGYVGRSFIFPCATLMNNHIAWGVGITVPVETVRTFRLLKEIRVETAAIQTRVSV